MTNLNTIPASVRDGFWKKVTVRNSDECWEWSGYCIKPKVSRLSYGVYRCLGKQQKAHRLAYKLTYGNIPADMCVCHKCDNPKCCNPSHLFLGTIADNNRDRDNKGRGVVICGKREGVKYVKGSKSPKAKITESQAVSIYSDLRSQRAIAREYGISQKAVSFIKRGESWSHVTQAKAAIAALKDKP
jgi:hypothetical protein